jgi:trimeric autotransporter adhesin
MTTHVNRKRRLVMLSAAAAALALTTSALAGSGPGDVFNLGQTNTVNGTSVLTGNTASPQLRVVNGNGAYAGIKAESAAGSGAAVFGLHNSTDGTGAGVLGYSQSGRGPGLSGVNVGGGPALSLWSNPAVPPLTVNSTALVANLNADQLDNTDSSGFWKLGGNALGSTAILGTTTNQALELKVNGKQAFRIDTASPPNLIGGDPANYAVRGIFGATISGGGSGAGRNRVGGSFGAVGGGYDNLAGNYATVAGGRDNAASGSNSIVAGGKANTAIGPYDAVAGGLSNKASGGSSTVAGGECNTASNYASTVAGGSCNTASGFVSSVAGGSSNTASGYHSAVVGGQYNTASGSASLAAGYHAVADDNGSFVWSDGAWSGGAVYSPAVNSFSAHATGGFNLWTNSSGPTTGCWIAAGGGSMNCSSSRKVKKDFASVDRATLLRSLNNIPVTTWSYKNEKAGVRHIGPMAQDFARAFKVGEDDTSIAMVDADGVSLAAIQGLYRQNVALRLRLSVQGARLSRLERLVTTLVQGQPRGGD